MQTRAEKAAAVAEGLVAGALERLADYVAIPAVSSQPESYDDVRRMADVAAADLREAVAILEDLNPRARRVFGPQHPETLAGEFALSYARRKLAAVDTAPA